MFPWGTGKEGFMVTPRGSITAKRWMGGVIVTLLTITAAILLAGLPVAAIAGEKDFMVNEGDKDVRFKIEWDSGMKNVTAIADGNRLDVPPQRMQPPFILGGKRISAVYPEDATIIYQGRGKIAALYPEETILVFQGSTCILVGGRWIGYPPGTRCP
jgi:hypothetical protein